MDQIFVVEGVVEHECSAVLRAFLTQEGADAFADLLRTHAAQEPRIESGVDHTDEEWDAHDAAVERWRNECPAGRSGTGFDSFSVVPVPMEQQAEEIWPEPDADAAAPTPHTTEIIYTWEDGREEVRYRRSYNSPEALRLVAQVLDLQQKHRAACPYSFRHV